MPQKNTNINNIINSLIDFLHDDVLLSKLTDSELEGEICFDCMLWNDGLIYPCDSSEPQVKILPIKNHFLRLLSDIEHFINSQLSNPNNKNYDYKSQLDRFLCIILDMKNKVASIICSNTCNDINIISVLLATLIQTILNLVNTLENINTLLSTNSSDCNCSCINSKTFEIFMGTFINSVTQLQNLLQDWYIIAITFFNYSSCAVKPYVASYIPKTYINLPKPPKPMTNICPPCTPNNSNYFNNNNPPGNFNNLNCT